jgi:hypothetical protein
MQLGLRTISRHRGSMAVLIAAALLAIPGVAQAASPAATSPQWTSQSPVSPPYRHGTLSDVSCVTPSYCVAVGSRSNKSAVSTPLGVVWNGTAWTEHSPASQPGQVLSRVSCTSTNFCLATGGSGTPDGYFQPGNWVEFWNGTQWSAPVLPLVSSAAVPGTVFTDVSCTSSTFCVAVAKAPASAYGSVAAQWNGSSWLVAFLPHPMTPSPTVVSTVSNVECRQANSCVALGQDVRTYPSGAFLATSWASRWDGTSWTTSNGPSQLGTPRTGYSVPIGLGCPTVSSCLTSVGTNIDQITWPAGGGKATWRKVPVTGPIDDDFVNSISCSAATNCTSIGDHSEGVWNGTTWTRGPTPLQGGFTALSCLPAGSCMTVGGINGGNDLTPVSATIVGTTFTRYYVPAQPGVGDSRLFTVSCGSSTSCLTGGYGPSNIHPLLEQWNGSAWALTSTSATNEVDAVACPTASTCVTVTDSRTLTATTNGVAKVTTPGGSVSNLSCWAANGCMAAAFTASSAVTTIATHGYLWNGTSWQATPSLPVQNNYNELPALSCSSATDCTLAGFSRSFSGTPADKPSLYHWNGTAWTSFAPPGGIDGAVLGISCPTAGFCLAVGRRTDQKLPILLSWNGTSWRNLTPPAATTGTAPLILNLVSCASATECVAVGGPADSSNGGLAATTWSGIWNSGAWTTVGLGSMPIGAKILSLDCPTTTRCVGVGSSSLADNDAPYAAIFTG